ncbi:MAG TPA: aminoglycoside phosphotransferase family protein [Mycobacterium sp.]
MATPALDLLLGAQARHVLAAAVGGYGGSLERLRVTAADIQPDTAAIVQYAGTVLRADGARTAEVLVATTGSRIPSGATVIEGDHLGRLVEVGVWRWPQDPALPALTLANDPNRLAELFRGFGLTTRRRLDISVHTYRPAHRAVLEVTDGSRTWFVKVVRPSAAAPICRRHSLVGPCLPVPPVLASTPDGLIVFPRAAGTPMRSLIRSGDTLPPPDALAGLLDSLPSELMGFPARPSHVECLHDQAAVLRNAAGTEPTVLTRVAEVVGAVDELIADAGPLVPVHGDFYEGQLLVDGDRITALLDLDTAGPGHRVDDWATLLAHLSGLTLDDGHRGPARRYAAEVMAQAQRSVPISALRRHTAAALVGFATGPFRAQQQGWPAHTVARLELAMKWLAGAVGPA